MVAKVRERILVTTISTCCATVLAGLILFMFEVKAAKNADIDTKLENKLDKEIFENFKVNEFVPFVEKNESEHDRIEGVGEARLLQMEKRILDNMNKRHDDLTTLIIEIRK